MVGRRLARRGRGVLAAGMVVALAGCWLQPNADGANTRWNPWERRITPANVGSLRQVWQRDLASDGAMQPLISGGPRAQVYVGRFSYSDPEAGIVALDLATGETLWDRTISPPGASPAFPMNPGVIIDGELWTGWSGGAGDPCSGTVRIDRAGNVVPTDGPGVLLPLAGRLRSGRYLVDVRLASCPKPPAPFPPIELAVSDIRTGETLWTAPGGNFSGTAAADGLVVTAEGGFALEGCGAPTCTPLWRPAEIGSTEPTVIGPGDDFFVMKGGFGVPTGEVVALSKATGQVSWRAPYQGFYAYMAVDDDDLFVSDSNGARLLAFDVDGCGAAVCSPVWSTAGGGGGTVIVGGDVVYVVTLDGTVKAYDADGCGRPVCSALGSVAAPGAAAMAVGEGHLLVATPADEGGRYRLRAFAPAG